MNKKVLILLAALSLAVPSMAEAKECCCVGPRMTFTIVPMPAATPAARPRKAARVSPQDRAAIREFMRSERLHGE